MSEMPNLAGSNINFGGNTRQLYDEANYIQTLRQSVTPLSYVLYGGAYENCNKCIDGNFYTPFDVIAIESELTNRTRPLTRSDVGKYQMGCVKSTTCMNTFDTSAPVIPSPDLCPIVFNNIKKPMSSGLPPMR